MKMEQSYFERSVPFIPGKFRPFESELDLAQLIRSLNDPAVGFAVAALAGPASPIHFDDAKRRVIDLMSGMASPIVVYRRHGLWKRIGVNTTTQAGKVEGTGIIPLHIDCVNTTTPPDYVAFLCTRRDPRDGGNSLVASFSRALAGLKQEQILTLGKTWVREGRFFDLDNVGVEMNPFPILEFSGPRREWVRYTAKPHNVETAPSELALKALSDELVKAAQQTELHPNEVLILNQHLAAHGRLALGDHQDRLFGGEQRELFQIFFRANGPAEGAENILSA